MNIQNLVLDINKKPFQTITANKGEVGSRFIRITIVDNSTPVDLTGVTISLYAKKPDGKKVFNSVTVEDKANGVVLAELTSQILSVSGLVRLTLLLVKNGSKLASKQFLVNVDESIVDDEAIESTNEFTALVDALGRVNNIDSRFEKVDSQLEHKMNKGDSITVSQIDRNKGKFDQTYMTDEFLQQIAGNTPIHSVPADNSIVSIKIANKSINANKMNFLISRIKGVQLKSGINTDGKRFYSETLNTTDFISIDRTNDLKIYQFSALNYYDSDKTLISGIKGSTALNKVIASSSIPENTSFIRLCYLIANNDYMYVNQSGELLEYKAIIEDVEKYKSEFEKDILLSDDSRINLFNENTSTFGVYINEYGVETEFTNYITSDYIEIFDDTYTTSANGYCAYYDENKNFIFSERHASGNKLKYNDTIRYVRVGFVNYGNTKYVVKGNYTTITNEYALNERLVNTVKKAIQNEEIKVENILNTNDILTKLNISIVDDDNLKTDLLKYDKSHTSVSYSYKLVNRINFYDSNKIFLGYVSTIGNYLKDFSNISILPNVEFLEFVINRQYYNFDSYIVYGDNTVVYNYKKTPVIQEPDFYTYLARNDLDSKIWRIPFVGVTKNSTILAGGEARYESSSDFSNCQIAIARSTDYGKTWENKQIVIPRSGIGSKSRSMCGTILTTKQGRVYLLGSLLEEGEWQNPIQTTINDWDLVLYYSDDDGVTWNFKKSLKSDVIKNPQIQTAIASIGNGIEMHDGTLVFCLPVSKKMEVAQDEWADTATALLYSKDKGETWTISSSLTPETLATENTIVEYENGKLLVNARKESSSTRALYVTSNLGNTWEAHITNNLEGEPNYNPMLKINYKSVDMIIYGHNESDRSKCKIRVLCANKKWISVDRTLPNDGGNTGYSCFAFDKTNNKLYWVFERSVMNFRDISYLLEDIYKIYIAYTDLLND